MHISDGIISLPVSVAANAVSLGLIWLSGRKTGADEIPGMGMTGAALFVVSLIHFPVAGYSIHLGLFGLAGIILGRRAFPVIFTVILFQTLIFQHGGLLAIGINAINMGAGAYAAWMIWQTKHLNEALRAIAAGFAGVFVPASFMAVEFRISGYGSGIFLLLSIYLIAGVIEAGISFTAVKFFRRVKPEILPG